MPAVALSVDPAPVAEVGDTPPHSIAGMTSRAERVALDICLSIPSVRKAVHTLAGTIATFELLPYNAAGEVLPLTGDRAWLAQPERRRTRQTTRFFSMLQIFYPFTRQSGVGHNQTINFKLKQLFGNKFDIARC